MNRQQNYEHHRGRTADVHLQSATSGATPAISSAAGFARSVELVSFLARRSLTALEIIQAGAQQHVCSQPPAPVSQAPVGFCCFTERGWSLEPSNPRERNTSAVSGTSAAPRGRSAARIIQKVRARTLESLLLDEAGCWLFQGSEREARAHDLGCPLSRRCANPAHREGQR